MSLVSGATVAGFSIVRQLEHVEFGELYVAEHPRLPRLQLLQLIPAEISADLDYREDFNQETDLAATLFHPNILGLTDRGEHENQLWISTEYLDGNDAAEMLGDQHHDGMPPKLVLAIVSAIAEALDYAHDQGVLHRHVNPGNIFISKGPPDKRRIALSGFGVARAIGDKTNSLTRSNIMIGTASYTAPERLMDDTIDGRADQYGLAASAFHLLTGSPPFAHFNPAVLMSKHLNERPPRPSDIRPDLIEYDAIFARALAQDPVDRFRRCRDLVRALELNGGKRSHVRATSDFIPTPDVQDAGASAVVAAHTNNGLAPTEPASLAPAPVTDVATPVVTSQVLPKKIVDEVTEKAAIPDSGDDFDDDFADDDFVDVDDDLDDDDFDNTEARGSRWRHAALIGGTILVVLVAWFIGVKALRTASQTNDTPSNVETTSTGPVAIPTPKIATPQPMAPPPPAPVMGPPPPVVPPPAPVMTSTVAPPVTTTALTPTSAATAPQTTRAVTTPPKPPTHPTTTTSGLDTRPALGMPCGPEQSGAAVVSNSGGPVNCVSTPGGFAWEPPGSQPPG